MFGNLWLLQRVLLVLSITQAIDFCTDDFSWLDGLVHRGTQNGDRGTRNRKDVSRTNTDVFNSSWENEPLKKDPRCVVRVQSASGDIVETHGCTSYFDGDCCGSENWGEEQTCTEGYQPLDIFEDCQLPQAEVGSRVNARWRESYDSAFGSRYWPATIRNIPYNIGGVLHDCAVEYDDTPETLFGVPFDALFGVPNYWQQSQRDNPFAHHGNYICCPEGLEIPQVPRFPVVETSFWSSWSNVQCRESVQECVHEQECVPYPLRAMMSAEYTADGGSLGNFEDVAAKFLIAPHDCGQIRKFSHIVCGCLPPSCHGDDFTVSGTGDDHLLEIAGYMQGLADVLRDSLGDDPSFSPSDDCSNEQLDGIHDFCYTIAKTDLIWVDPTPHPTPSPTLMPTTPTEPEHSSSGMVVGIAGGSAAIIAVILAVVLYRSRCRKSKPANKDVELEEAKKRRSSGRRSRRGDKQPNKASRRGSLVQASGARMF